MQCARSPRSRTTPPHWPLRCACSINVSAPRSTGRRGCWGRHRCSTRGAACISIAPTSSACSRGRCIAELACDGVARRARRGGTPRAARWRRSRRRHALSDIDLAVLLITLAPDLDLKYEKIYGYLQDDLTRKRATPDLAANLLALRCRGSGCASCAHLGGAAPLSRAGLGHSAATRTLPWLARPLARDVTWLGWLLGREMLDPSLASHARLRVPHRSASTLCRRPEIRARAADACA